MIWYRVPKTRYVGLIQLEIGEYDPVANFNDGRTASLDILKELGLDPGNYCIEGCSDLDNSRINSSINKSKESVKHRRKVIRGRGKKERGQTF